MRNHNYKTNSVYYPPVANAASALNNWVLFPGTNALLAPAVDALGAANHPLASASIQFPDPWPKKRHHKNRLISEPFPPLAKRLLREGGNVYLRTDNIEYFEQMLEVFGDAKGFEAVETPESLKGLVTDFEQEFNLQGIPTNYAAYRSVGE